jgi:hypothetical protein
MNGLHTTFLVLEHSEFVFIVALSIEFCTFSSVFFLTVSLFQFVELFCISCRSSLVVINSLSLILGMSLSVLSIWRISLLGTEFLVDRDFFLLVLFLLD